MSWSQSREGEGEGGIKNRVTACEELAYWADVHDLCTSLPTRLPKFTFLLSAVFKNTEEKLSTLVTTFTKKFKKPPVVGVKLSVGQLPHSYPGGIKSRR